MKKTLTWCLIFSLAFNNLALATHQILELDFKDSTQSQRLHVMPRLSHVDDVSYVEIDQEKQHVIVHKLKQQDDSLSETQGTAVVPLTSPIIIQKWNVQNLPWDLEIERLITFVLNHNAWLKPLGEDTYKLEFRGSLLGGMPPKKQCQEECIHYEGVCFPMSVITPFFPSVLGSLANFVKEAALKQPS